MYHKCKEFRIHQNERVVSKRLKLAKEIGHSYRVPGKLRKFNMTCSCGMCDINHPQKVKKSVDSIKVIHKIKMMEERIHEF